MLKNTFLHISGVGLKKEKKIWENQAREWNSFLKNNNSIFSKSQHAEILEKIELSKLNLSKKDANYFYNVLPSNEQWRLFHEFKNNVLYLDIETNGSNPDSNIITTISTYDGENIKYYVNGKNLDEFVNHVYQYKILITYNGKTFDIPFIEKFFNIQLDHAQIDLRYVLKNLGYKGGLKSCEKQLGLLRNELDGVDGYFAIHLWNDYYYNNNIKALNTLLAYNIEDVINLEHLMHLAYNLNIEKLGLDYVEKVTIPQRPEILFKPDMNTIKDIKSKMNPFHSFDPYNHF